MCVKKKKQREENKKNYVGLYKYIISLKDIQETDDADGQEEETGWQREGREEELSL